ncbi:hypothetical protein O6H91_16G080000 [Diphasiastrum complanatum]|uniref:Uncharacterized protein n=1 Tax=Diphasiastrum complanatum TaxID=34168 RepID=A0ACC2BE46_DIPCM|nr:hypothetical protein O6H91_16G080000 [Diphasiastrum complanatum]
MREEDFGIDQGQAVFNYDLESLQSDDYYEAESRFSETDGSSQDVSQQQYSSEMLSRSDSVMLERRVVAVIGEEHCSPCKRTFLMARNVFQLGLSCNIHVTDEEGKLVYQVDRWGVRPGQKRVIRDASGRILVRLNCKTHWKAEWVAYTDNDSETTEIFKVTPRPSVELRRKCKVCVTRSVAENLEKKIFEIKKNSCFARNYTVFHGETIIAEVRFFFLASSTFYWLLQT